MGHKFINIKSFFAELSKPFFLFKNLWKEGTTSLLHAPRSVDKTATALKIANDIAQSGRDVLYVNADRIDSQAKAKADADQLYIFTPEFESIDDNRDYADIVFEAIEDAVRNTSIRTFVIDSITRIAALSFGRNSSPAYIMKRLVALQVKCKLSILVVADDTTKSANNALLALAASEITINEEDSSQMAKPELPKDNKQPGNPYMLYNKPVAIQTSTPITRQQRRALERKQQKKSASPIFKSVKMGK